jgi:hypothetical protein
VVETIMASVSTPNPLVVNRSTRRRFAMWLAVGKNLDPKKTSTSTSRIAVGRAGVSAPPFRGHAVTDWRVRLSYLRRPFAIPETVMHT